jgi:hypothetical protein
LGIGLAGFNSSAAAGDVSGFLPLVEMLTVAVLDIIVFLTGTEQCVRDVVQWRGVIFWNRFWLG